VAHRTTGQSQQWYSGEDTAFTGVDEKQQWDGLLFVAGASQRTLRKHGFLVEGSFLSSGHAWRGFLLLTQPGQSWTGWPGYPIGEKVGRSQRRFAT